MSPEPALARKNDGYIGPSMAILAPSVPSIGPHFATKDSWTVACVDAAPIPAKQKGDAPMAAAPLQATDRDAKSLQAGESYSCAQNRIAPSAGRRILGSSSSSSSSISGGRVDKRKRRHPTRSLPARDSGCDSRCFYTVKMSFVDDYQRNPTAYSRALMDTERPHSGSQRSSSRHMYNLPLLNTNAGSMQSGALSAPASTTSFCRGIEPPALSLSPSDAVLCGNNRLKRVHSSSASLSPSLPLSSTIHVQSPRVQPESSLLQVSERKRPPELRKSMSAAIQRLFPSLKASINALATSSSQACAGNNKTVSSSSPSSSCLAYKSGPARCTSAIMRPPEMPALGSEAPPSQLSSSAAPAKNIRSPLYHHHHHHYNNNN
ncbi:hypothetical protein LPJ75_003088, partial [Coemansia sp. RSA 2598]